MQVQQLRFFVAAAKAENISRAAQALFVSQPNLSLSIKKLETELEVPLFHHRRGKVSLTPSGQIFLEYAERALEELEAGIQAARNVHRLESHQVRMATPLPDLLAKVLPGYVRTHSHISVRQFNYTNSQCLEALENGAVDIAVAFGPVESGKLEYLEADSSPRVVMVGARHPLAGRASLHMEELNGLKCVCNLSRGDNNFFSRLKDRGIHPQILCECDNDSVELSVLHAGMAASACAERNVQKLRRDYPAMELHMLRLEGEDEQVSVGCAIRKGVQLTADLQELIAQIAEKLEVDSGPNTAPIMTDSI